MIKNLALSFILFLIPLGNSEICCAHYCGAKYKVSCNRSVAGLRNCSSVDRCDTNRRNEFHCFGLSADNCSAGGVKSNGCLTFRIRNGGRCFAVNIDNRALNRGINLIVVCVPTCALKGYLNLSASDETVYELSTPRTCSMYARVTG